MTRAELAKELRNFREGELRSPPLSTPQWKRFLDLLDRIAAALEEEDQNARRYRRLRHCAVKMWLESQQKLFYLKLLPPFHPYPRYGQIELDAEEADDQFDKTLDAWIEEHADA